MTWVISDDPTDWVATVQAVCSAVAAIFAVVAAIYAGRQAGAALRSVEIMQAEERRRRSRERDAHVAPLLVTQNVVEQRAHALSVLISFDGNSTDAFLATLQKSPRSCEQEWAGDDWRQAVSAARTWRVLHAALHEAQLRLENVDNAFEALCRAADGDDDARITSDRDLERAIRQAKAAAHFVRAAEAELRRLINETLAIYEDGQASRSM